MTTLTATDYNSMLATFTTQEAKDILDKVIRQIAELDADYETLISKDDVRVIGYAINTNIQLRDYLMGLTIDGLSVESAANILRVLIALVNSVDMPVYPFETILATYMYRAGDSDAIHMLGNALAKDYSLALLLKRVFSAGMPAIAFDLMTSELHPQVVANLADTASELVNEDAR